MFDRYKDFLILSSSLCNDVILSSSLCNDVILSSSLCNDDIIIIGLEFCADSCHVSHNCSRDSSTRAGWEDCQDVQVSVIQWST